MFDGAFTGPGGVHGTLGQLGSDSDIGLAESAPVRLSDHGAERRQFAEAQKSRHKAVVLLTGGTRPGLFLVNASSFLSPVGPPMLQISSAEREWLTREADRRAEATIVIHTERAAA
jgi:hypothetical protein